MFVLFSNGPKLRFYYMVANKYPGVIMRVIMLIDMDAPEVGDEYKEG